MGFRLIRATLTTARVATISMRQLVPGHVRQITLFVNENPGHLLESPATRTTSSFVSPTPACPFPCSPRRRVQQPARKTAHPGRELQGRNPSKGHPVSLGRARRAAECLFDTEGAPYPFHVANLSIHGIAPRTVPGTDVLHHHQTIRAVAHDRADRALAQQVRQANGYVYDLVSHGHVSFLNFARGHSWILNAPVPSTFRIECKVAHRAGRASPCA